MSYWLDVVILFAAGVVCFRANTAIDRRARRVGEVATGFGRPGSTAALSGDKYAEYRRAHLHTVTAVRARRPRFSLSKPSRERA